MIIQSQPFPRRQSGYALIIIMLFLAVSLIVFGSMMSWVASSAKVTQRNNLFNAAQAAAESATEVVLGNMIRDFSFQSLNPSNTYTPLPLAIDQTGWPVRYQFSNIAVGIGAVPTNFTTVDSQFAGLYGLVQFCTNSVTATPTNAEAMVSATVQQIIEFASIPIFQYAIFYNIDLEVGPGKTMTINGHVHSNGNIWSVGSSSTERLVYAGMVDASITNYYKRSPNDPQSYSTGNVDFTLANNPIDAVPSLAMPIGDNNNPVTVAAMIDIPPLSVIAPIDSAYSPTGQVYLYNGADLIISNGVSGTNISVYYDNPFITPRLTPVLPDVVTTNYSFATLLTTTNSYYSYVTNVSFYDYRESDTVKAVQIDVNKFRIWLTNYVPLITNTNTSRGGNQYNVLNSSGGTTKGHGINSIYVYNNIARTGTQLPAVRLVNGARLPAAGLTVATAQPLYIKGNYNTTTNGTTFATGLGSTTNGATLPAAVMGDAVTILSTNWSDAYTSSTLLSGRGAANTTINAACLEGIVVSVTDSGGTKHYSGGVENFLRLLEDWTGDTLTYNGSIVVLFPSQYATNYWINPGTYYNPPTRNWGFDVNFSKGQAYLPPLTPQVKETLRNSWTTK